MSMTYISASAVVASDVRNAEPGFVHMFGPFSGPGLIVHDKHGRYLVYLQPGNEFVFMSLQKARGVLKGLLHREPTIEVDHETAFDPDRGDGEGLGDLLMQGTRPHIVAKPSGDSWGEHHRVALWPTPETIEGGDLPWVGFRKWRLVIMIGEDRHVLWERTPT
jgi:hypothetical protein